MKIRYLLYPLIVIVILAVSIMPFTVMSPHAQAAQHGVYLDIELNRVAAPVPTTIDIVAPDNVGINESFTIDIVITPGEEISGYQFDLAFNADVMRVDAVVDGGFFGGKALFAVGVIDNVNGTVSGTYAAFLDKGGISAAGTAVRYQCTAIGNGLSIVSLQNIILGNPAGGTVAVKAGQASITIGSLVEYPIDIDTDREKLDACERLIQEMIDEHNRVGQLYRDGKIDYEKWNLYAIRPAQFGGNVFDQHLLPLLKIRNELRDRVLQSYLETNKIEWEKLTKDEKVSISFDAYGDKEYIRQQPTLATIDTLDKLKSVDINQLTGALPPDPLVDYTTFSETDEDGYLTVTSSRITATALPKDALAHVIYNYGSDHFGDFEHLEHFYLTSCQEGTGAVFWGISDNYYTDEEMNDNSEGLCLTSYSPSNNSLRIYIVDYTNSNSDYYTASSGNDYYFTIERNGTTATYKIYSDSDRTNLLDTPTITCGTDTYSHIIGAASRYDPPDTDEISFYVEDLDLQEAASEADISESQNTHAFGIGVVSTSYWACGYTPSFPLNVTDCTFNVTNNSGASVDISFNGDNWTGGTNWTLSGTPGADAVRVRVGINGTDVEGNLTTLTGVPQLVIDSLGDGESMPWAMVVDTPTSFSDGNIKTSNITLSAVLE